MTGRERFLATLAHQKCDRVPFLEEGLRPEVFQAWGIESEQLLQPAPADQHIMLMLENGPIPEPRRWPVGAFNMPDFLTRLDPHHPDRFGSEWQDQIRLCTDPKIIRILRVHNGFFQTMGVDDWQRFDEIITLMAEDPDFVEDYMRNYARHSAKILQIALDSQTVEAVYFNEPIGGINQPLISPADYRRFGLDTCMPLLDVLHERGIENIIFMSYSNVRKLLPMLVDRGFNCLWSCETDHPDMDYTSIRAEFGDRLRLIGGIDLKILTLDDKEMRNIIDKKIIPLIMQGGFIPLVNGRVRKNILPEKYFQYRRILFQAIIKSGRSRIC